MNVTLLDRHRREHTATRIVLKRSNRPYMVLYRLKGGHTLTPIEFERRGWALTQSSVLALLNETFKTTYGDKLQGLVSNNNWLFKAMGVK